MNKIVSILGLCVLASAPALAHHGTNGQFDASKLLTVTGVISDLAFVNPHAYVYVDVTDENGEVATWNCEMRASSVLRRSGWTPEMFANGTPVHIEGVAARRDPLGCYIETISFKGGAPIERYAQLSEAQIDDLLSEDEVEELVESRPALTAWGDPNIDGDWAAEQRLVGAISGPAAAGMGPGPGRGPRPGGVQLTEAGEAYRAEVIDAEDNVAGRLDCQPRDFFSDWTFDQPSNRIIQEQDKITLKYGFMDTERVIHLNMDEHPENLTPSWAGHSIGKWEDGELVVDTIGFTRFASNRSTRSEQYHTTERFALDHDAGSLTRTYTAEDPLFLQGQQSGSDVVFVADYPWEPYACDDRSVE